MHELSIATGIIKIVEKVMIKEKVTGVKAVGLH